MKLTVSGKSKTVSTWNRAPFKKICKHNKKKHHYLIKSMNELLLDYKDGKDGFAELTFDVLHTYATK
jgi:hypothetical protein